MVEEVHLVAVALRVGCAGAGAAGLGPVDLGAALGVEVEGAQARLAGQLQHDATGHALARAEDRGRGQLRAVQHDGEALQPIEEHGWEEEEEGEGKKKSSVGREARRPIK